MASPVTVSSRYSMDSSTRALPAVSSFSTMDSSTRSLVTSKKFYDSGNRVDPSPQKQKNDLPLGTIRIYGADREGIDLALCQLLHGHGCSISHAEQHRDKDLNCFFQRIEFDYCTMHTDQTSLEYGVQEVCGRFRMEFELNWGTRPKRMCIFVSKYDHVLWDILLRYKAGDFKNCEIPLIISNHAVPKSNFDPTSFLSSGRLCRAFESCHHSCRGQTFLHFIFLFFYFFIFLFSDFSLIFGFSFFPPFNVFSK